MARIKYPIGIQHFEDLRTSGFAYVDKTKFVYNLYQDGRVYFLSRPRRFGKSLLISTLKAFFEGKKHLFEGLAIERLMAEDNEAWVERPVFHISFAIAKHSGENSLDAVIEIYLSEWEELYGRNEKETTISTRFMGLIKRAHEQSGQQIAILVDEYDAPLLDAIGDPELVKSLRLKMRDFFSPLKDMGEHIRFLFLTGVTKFSQLSVFSELNHLLNISMLPQYAAICGITQEEIETNFSTGIAELATTCNQTKEETMERLRHWYDGYHFSKDSPDIYNPFSLLHVLAYKLFDSYWFASGTPTFLLELLRMNRST